MSIRPPPIDPVLGRTFAQRYEPQERVGADALGRIYRGVDRSSDAPVLLTVLHGHLASSPRFASRFIPETEPLRRLDHPGIVKVLDTARDGAQLLLVTEPFEGRNLCSIVHGRGLLPAAQLIAIVLQVLEALGEAHSAGVLHLDLNPEDIVIGATIDGAVRPKVRDFVVGRLAAEVVARISLGGSSLGTPLYASPERLRGEACDLRSDIYSLGAILYEQLTGTPPFDAVSPIAMSRLHQDAVPESLRQRAPNRSVDSELETVVLKALSKDPGQRFQSASEMAQAIEAARAREHVSEAGPTPASLRRQARQLSKMLHVSGLFRRPHAVGRDDVVDSLKGTCLAAAEEPLATGRVAIVLGAAGMGKTAVVDEIMAALTGGPVCVLRIEGRRSLCSPLEPFAEAARDLLDVPRGASEVSVKCAWEFLRTRLDMAEDEIVRVLDRLSARGTTLSATPDIVEREEVGALRALFGRALACAPSVLIAEDADALDAASSRLVLDLMEASAWRPMSVVVTARGEPWPEWNARNAARMSIGPLESDQCVALLRERLSGCGLSAEGVESVAALSKGSPLVLELYIQAVQAEQALRGSAAALPSTQAATRTLVDTVLRAAPKPARTWLRCAALFGLHAPVEMLEQLAASPDGRDATLRACAHSGLVRVEGNAVVYRNEGVREMVVDLVAERDRREQQRAIARWLGAGTPPRGSVESVAAQLEAASDHAQAGEMFERAAAALLERGEPRAAASLYKRAITVWQLAHDSGAVMRAGLSQAEAFVHAGDGKAANDVLSRLERFGTVKAEGLRARVIAVIAKSQGDPELALRTLQRASEIAVDSLDQKAWYQVETDLAELFNELSRPEQAEPHASLAHELAVAVLDANHDQTGWTDSTRVSQSASLLARLRVSLGRFNEARSVLQQSLEVAAGRGDEASASRVLANLAFVASCQNDVREAAELADRALAFSQKAGDRMAAARIAINIGSYRARLGHQSEAALSFTLAKTLSRSIGWRRGVELSRDALRRLAQNAALPPS